ncbi:hypothetical protein U9M48_003937 [Paspalum notatum var. saurae]|uniref:Uncharacterized protein n=1 Tax=Paspalum notatum var. saurae TaxID=547442 RepID=A0AAQ3SL11_PASNO
MLRDAVGVGEYTDLQLKKLKRLVESMKTPLYPGCKEKWSKLLGSLKLLQLKATHHWTDHSFRALCELLCDILRKGDEVPKTTYEAKQNICPLGLEVEKVHACKNDCILFRGDDYADLTECLVCGTPRYKQRKDGSGMVFPCTCSPDTVACNQHRCTPGAVAQGDRKTDNCLWHLIDSAQWRIIDFKYGSFAQEPRNLRFALSTDGMNPFGQMSTSYSVWHVILSIYNLPPWVCTKRKYMMMSMLILGPRQPGNDIDVYLRPLVDDLKKLWSEGIEVYDGYK